MTPYPTTVSDRGTGPAVVLVHGTPLDAGAWDVLGSQLAGRHRVVTYDLRGHGTASATPVPGSYAPLARDLELLLDELEIERAHVAGHSFGGQVAAVFAAMHPDRLTALTIVCARSSPYPAFDAAADAIERDGIQPFADGAVARWFTPDAIARDEPAVRYARLRLVPAAARTLAATLRMIAGFDLGDSLAALPVPGRFVAAEHDLVAAPDDLRAAAATLPDGEFLLERGANHMLPVEHPERLAALDW